MSLNCSSMTAVDYENNAVSTYVAETEPLQGFRFFSRLVGRSDLWSKNGGSFYEMMGLNISN